MPHAQAKPSAQLLMFSQCSSQHLPPCTPNYPKTWSIKPTCWNERYLLRTKVSKKINKCLFAPCLSPPATHHAAAHSCPIKWSGFSDKSVLMVSLPKKTNLEYTFIIAPSELGPGPLPGGVLVSRKAFIFALHKLRRIQASATKVGTLLRWISRRTPPGTSNMSLSTQRHTPPPSLSVWSSLANFTDDTKL